MAVGTGHIAVVAAIGVPYTTALLLAAAMSLPAALHGGVIYSARLQRAAAGGSPLGVGVVTLWPPANGAAVAGWRVRAENGNEVAHKVLWARDNEPLLLCFGLAGGATEYVAEALDRAEGANPPWEPESGLLVETRRLPQGTTTIDNWDEALAAWEAAEPVGLSTASHPFSGVPPHGLGAFCAVRFSGWLEVGEPGEYALATASIDASFVAVDGRQVAAWPGRHGCGGGIYGEHQGTVRLERGRHRFEYYNFVSDAGYSVVAAWRKPGAKNFAVIPASAFPGMEKFALRDVASGGQVAPLLAWRGNGYVLGPPASLFGVRFTCPGAVETDDVRWRFDDGVQAAGAAVDHVFVGERLAEVWCEVRRGGKDVAQLSRRIRLQRRPLQREVNPAAELGQFLHAIGTPQGLKERNIVELPQLFRVADDAGHPALAAIAATLFQRRGECHALELGGLYELGFYYQRPQARDPQKVDDVWQSVLAHKECAAVLRARTALHLAGFLIHSGRDTSRGLGMLERMADDSLLDDGERRLKIIFRGDGALLLGDRNGGLAEYSRAGLTVKDDDTSYEVRRRARLETARHYLARGEYEAAERVLRELEWERPLERLNLETGLLVVDLHRRRGEPDLALVAGRRLLVGAPADPARPDLLLALCEINRDLGRRDDVAGLLRQLRQDYPYSEAAAIASDRFQDMR